MQREMREQQQQLLEEAKRQREQVMATRPQRGSLSQMVRSYPHLACPCLQDSMAQRAARDYGPP